MYVHVHICCYSALIQLVAAATIRERRLFRSALAQVWLLFESGVYSRAASIRSYTVVLKSRKPLEQTQIVIGSQDKSSIQSSLDVRHDVSPRACAVFVNVTGSHMTFIACHLYALDYFSCCIVLYPPPSV